MLLQKSVCFLAHLSTFCAQSELLWQSFVRRPSVRECVRVCVNFLIQTHLTFSSGERKNILKSSLDEMFSSKFKTKVRVPVKIWTGFGSDVRTWQVTLKNNQRSKPVKAHLLSCRDVRWAEHLIGQI